MHGNEYIAIWNFEMDSAGDTDVLAANIVHEMLHCFQWENRETRYPDDLELLMYPQNLENFNAKFFENKYLAEAFWEKDKEIRTACSTDLRLYEISEKL